MSNATDLLPPIPSDIAATTGPQIIGTLINWALYGVLSVQTYVYYLNFPDDNIWNKLLVYGSYIVEVVQTAMTAADLCFWFASGFGNMNHLGNVNISPVDTPILCGIIAAVVQCFFAYRIYNLRRSLLWVSVLIVLTSIVQTVGAFGVGYRAFKLQEYVDFHENVIFPQSFDVWLLGDTVCDVLIASTMLWLLYLSRKEGTKYGSQILARYSNTLLVTFNNRIALRTVNSTNDINFEGKGSDRLPIRRPSDFNSEVSTFHVTTDKLGGKSAGFDSQDIATLTDNKSKELNPLFSAV